MMQQSPQPDHLKPNKEPPTPQGDDPWNNSTVGSSSTLNLSLIIRKVLIKTWKGWGGVGRSVMNFLWRQRINVLNFQLVVEGAIPTLYAAAHRVAGSWESHQMHILLLHSQKPHNAYTPMRLRDFSSDHATILT